MNATATRSMSYAQIINHLSYTNVAIGFAGELMLSMALQERGYECQIEHERGDLTLYLPDGRKTFIEVKNARKGTDHKWRFTLWKDGHCDHRAADLIALLCVLRSGFIVPFLVPVEELSYQRQAVITSYPPKYKGRLSHYRQDMKSLSV